jgi:ligand-binding sensor domain-containing protein/serine phosphatase RsbU (regulator of sigma subunit)
MNTGLIFKFVSGDSCSNVKSQMIFKLLKYKFLAFLLLTSGVLSSQQYNIKQFSTKNGLVNSNVNQIKLDSRGYLWFATQGGLSRFDGKNFLNFTSKEGLSGNNVTSICEDNNGNIWIASYGEGLSVFNGKEFQKFGRGSGIKSLDILSVYCDFKNNLWLATNGGITMYDGRSFRNYGISDGLPDGDYFCSVEDKQHTMWFGSHKNGLVSFNGKSFRSYNQSDGLSVDAIYSLQNDQQGNLWIGTISGGICKFDGKAISQQKIPGTEKLTVFAIVQDEKSNMWFATESGLFKLDGMGHSTSFTEKNGLNSNTLYSLCVDYEGNIWTGSTLGANLLKNEAFITYGEKEGLSNPKVNSVIEDSYGNFLIGTFGSGISILNAKGIEPIKIKELENAKITTLFEDSKQRIWVGCESNENPLLVLSQNMGKYELIKKFAKLNKQPISTISKVLEDHAGDIWVSSYGAGAFKISGDKVTQYNDSSNVKSANILTMLKDKESNIWFGTFENGVVKYDGKKFINYTKKDGLGDNWIWCMCEDKKGNLYFGTNENGVTCYDGKLFKSISTKQGLASDLIYSLSVDSKGRLWVGTDKGINKLSVDNDFNLISSKYYGEQEGLKSVEINQNGFVYDQSGHLWICTTNGLTRYNPKFDYISTSPPRVILNGIRLYYQNVDWTKYSDKTDPVSKLPLELSLSHKDNHLTFDYQALTTDNVHYTFKLDGLDADWSPLTTNTQAVYTNIPPGANYNFHVKAINGDGVWTQDIVSFKFSITPPFWKTWWFLSICIVVILGSLIVFIRVRTAKLENEKKVLEEKVEERTIELKGANDQLSLAFKDIKDSINYAKRIQQAILPLESEIRKDLPDHFILFKPRDVVSGDFYWFNKKNEKLYIAACDCTGHGVPGAFMSIIGNSLLNEIAHEASITEPAQILNMLRDKIIFSLKQHSGEMESKDGMDMMLCCIDKKNGKLSFAGANNPLYVIRKGEFKEYKSNKQPIGVYGDVLKPFTNQEIDILPGDLIYLFSDGYPDQFGGPLGKKFLYTRFKELLVSISSRSMDQQHADLERSFWDWKMEHEQVDDVLVIGIKI